MCGGISLSSKTQFFLLDFFYIIDMLPLIVEDLVLQATVRGCCAAHLALAGNFPSPHHPRGQQLGAGLADPRGTLGREGPGPSQPVVFL